jgi:NAD(P)-dependent dehydrogenase (short-subunit alcohol dehydrogenase family)
MDTRDTKVTLITGASSGIGAALAREFVTRGHAVALLARRTERIAALADSLTQSGARVLAIRCDVTVDGDVERAVQHTVERFGRLDCAVANAGISHLGKFEDMHLRDYRRVFETNVFGALRTAQASFEPLKRARGAFAAVGSVSGYFAMAGLGAYNASKYALRGFVETLAHEWRHHGISVTHVAPGFVASDLRVTGNDGATRADAKDPVPPWLVMPADKAARQIADAIQKRRREVIITRHGKAAVFVARHAQGVMSRALDPVPAPSSSSSS